MNPEARVSPASADALEAAVEALRCLNLAGQEFRIRFAAYAKINTTDALALSHLAATDALTSGELAARVGLAPSGATGLVDRLERAGLARRATRPGNRRTVYISLTAMGADALTLAQAYTKQAVLDIGEDRLEGLTDLLVDLCSALKHRAQDFDEAARNHPL